jgi:hypothetical protein
MTDAGGDIGTKEALSPRAAPLDILLTRLAAGGDVAPEYERLRLRLVTYFRLRFPADAEALADEAIDRLARRLLETGARRRKERDAAGEALLEIELDQQEAEPDPAMPALRACLEAIGPESAALILDYYAADTGATRIARRQALAQRSGMSLNALRNRALRIRMGLEKCVRARLQAGMPRPLSRSDETVNSDTREMMQSGPPRW